ncbi:MAG: putative internalin, partial [Solirubrobacteraceae bacterium]|nr:putative internalin [Solirubrobacteraceae bacterium]
MVRFNLRAVGAAVLLALLASPAAAHADVAGSVGAPTGTFPGGNALDGSSPATQQTAETFYAAASGQVTQISISPWSVGSGNSFFTLSLRAVDATGAPTGGDLGAPTSANASPHGVDFSAPHTITANVTNGATLTAGTQYALVVTWSFPTTTTNWAASAGWTAGVGGPYSLLTNDGSGWFSHGAVADQMPFSVTVSGSSAPTVSTPASISGTAKPGQTLTGAAAFDGSPAPTTSYEWDRCAADGTACSPISGATSSTYAVTSDDVGHVLQFIATATNTSGSIPSSAQTAAVSPLLAGDWTFANSTDGGEQTGYWGDFQLKGTGSISNGQLVVSNDANGGANNRASAWGRATGYTGPTLDSKTLIAWVQLDNTTSNGGAPLSLVIPNGGNAKFDAIDYGEISTNRWMPGSDHFLRQNNAGGGWFPSGPADDANSGSGTMRQIAISYSDNGNGTETITGCLNGVQIGQYTASNIQTFGSDTDAVFGPRHVDDAGATSPVGGIDAHIDEARVYAGALSCSQLPTLADASTTPLPVDLTKSSGYSAANFLKKATLTGGSLSTQAACCNRTGTALTFSASNGNAMTVPFSVSTTGAAELSTGLTTSSSGGTLRFFVDGQQVGSDVDTYSATQAISKVDLGSLSLAAGTHALTIKSVGKNAASSGYGAVLNDIDTSAGGTQPSAPGDHNAVDPGTTNIAHVAVNTTQTIEVSPTLSDDSGTPTQARITAIPSGVTLQKTDGTPIAAGGRVDLVGGALDLKFTSSSASDGQIGYAIVDPSDTSTAGDSSSSTLFVDVSPDAPLLTAKPTTSQGDSDARTSFPFRFTSTYGVSYKCALDGGSYSTCTSPDDITGLSSGSHTFSVESVDSEGDVNATGWTWTVDRTLTSAQSVTAADDPGYNPQNAPTNAGSLGADTGIAVDASHPLTVSAAGTWYPCGGCAIGPDGGSTWSANTLASYAPGASLVAKVGSGPWFEIGSGPTSVTGTGELYLAMNDYPGGFGDNSGSLLVTIAPTTMTASIGSAPAGGSTTSANVRFTFSGADSNSGTLSYDCSLDGVTFTQANCTSPDAESYANGERRFSVRVTNASTHKSVIAHSSMWNVNSAVSPVATPTESAGPADDAPVDSAPTYTFGSSTSGVSYECQLDGGVWSSCTSPKPLTGLADGLHTFAVRAFDSSGNVSAAFTRSFTLDTAPPSQPTLGAHPAALTSDPNPAFTFASADPSPSSGALTYTCQLDGQPPADCSSGSAHYSGLADGSHTFTVTAKDPAGNTSQQTSSFELRTALPSATIVRPTDGARYSTTQDVTAPYSCTAVSPAVLVTCAADVDGHPVAAGAVLPQLGVGSHTFTLHVVDDHGNARTYTRTFTQEPFKQLVLDDDPIAYFRLDDASNSSTMASSTSQLGDGEYKNATQSSPFGISGDNDTARHFSGDSGYGFVNGVQAPAYSMTLLTWVRFDDVRDSSIVDDGWDNALDLIGGRFVLRHQGTSITDTRVGSSFDVVPNAWYLVVGRISGNLMQLYVAEQGDSKYTPPVLAASGRGAMSSPGSSTFYLGYGQDAPWLHGSLDETAYF